MFDGLLARLKATLSGRRSRTSGDPHLTPSAVLVLIYPRDGEPYVLFTERTEQVEHHKGEVSFPGGAREPGDASLQDTALREAAEELGIAPGDVNVIGTLGDTSTASGFLIRSFVGSIKEGYRLRPNPEEIAQVIEVPLKALAGPEGHRSETRWTGGQPRAFSSFAYGGHLIWGATAGIVERLVEALHTMGWRAGDGS